MNPAAARNFAENIQFAKYLQANELKIDAWNAKDHTHFGTSLISLKRLLSQGEPSRDFATEFALLETDND